MYCHGSLSCHIIRLIIAIHIIIFYINDGWTYYVIWHTYRVHIEIMFIMHPDAKYCNNTKISTIQNVSHIARQKFRIAATKHNINTNFNFIIYTYVI